MTAHQIKALVPLSFGKLKTKLPEQREEWAEFSNRRLRFSTACMQAQYWQKLTKSTNQNTRHQKYDNNFKGKPLGPNGIKAFL